LDHFRSLPFEEAFVALYDHISGPQVLEQGNDALTTSMCTFLSRKIPGMNEFQVASNLDSMRRLQHALSGCSRSDVPALARLHDCFSFALSSFAGDISLGGASAHTASLASLTSPSRQADLGFSPAGVGSMPVTGANDSCAHGEIPVVDAHDELLADAFDDALGDEPVDPQAEGDLNVRTQAPSAEGRPSDSQTGESSLAGVDVGGSERRGRPAAAVLEAARTAAVDNGLCGDSAADELAEVVEKLIRKVVRAVGPFAVSCTICGRTVSTKSQTGYCMKPGSPACRQHTFSLLDTSSQQLIYAQVCQDQVAAQRSKDLSRRCQRLAVAADCSSHTASEAALQCAEQLGRTAPLDAGALTSVVKAVISTERAYRATDEALQADAVKCARAKIKREVAERRCTDEESGAADAVADATADRAGEVSTEAADRTGEDPTEAKPAVSRGMAGRTFYCNRCSGHFLNGQHLTGSDRCVRLQRASAKAAKSTPSSLTCTLCHRHDGSSASPYIRRTHNLCGKLGDASCFSAFQALYCSAPRDTAPSDLLAAPVSAQPELLSLLGLTDGRSPLPLVVFGGPGVGKSFLVERLAALLRLSLRSRGSVAVVAGYGRIAENVGGSTIHSWAGLLLGDEQLSIAEVAERIRENKAALGRWQEARVLVIDDASVVSAELFDCLEKLARAVRMQPDLFFGGLLLVLQFDLFQLYPVSGAETLEMREPLFHSYWWQRAPLTQALHVHLTQNHRFGDPQLVQLLTAIRDGSLDDTHWSTLEDMTTPLEKRATTVPKAVTLASLRRTVTSLSHEALRKLPGDEVVYDVVRISAPGSKHRWSSTRFADGSVRLKLNAAVMFALNIPALRLSNGTLGVVVGFERASAAAACFSPWPELPRVRWVPSKGQPFETLVWPEVQELPGSGESSPGPTFEFFLPILLAEALTVHKAVGSNLPAVVIHCSDRFFGWHQLYEALSRTSSVSRIELRGYDSSTFAEMLAVSPAAKHHTDLLVKASLEAPNAEKVSKLLQLLGLAPSAAAPSATAPSATAPSAAATSAAATSAAAPYPAGAPSTQAADVDDALPAALPAAPSVVPLDDPDDPLVVLLEATNQRRQREGQNQNVEHELSCAAPALAPSPSPAGSSPSVSLRLCLFVDPVLQSRRAAG
jgi:ATP-dependent DNA helicase PIF1